MRGPLTPTSVPSIPSKRFDVNRTLLPLLSLSVLVCENGPAVPSQRGSEDHEVLCWHLVLRTIQWFLVEGGALSSHPTPRPQHLGDTCRPVAPASDLGDLGQAVSHSTLQACGPCRYPPPGVSSPCRCLPGCACIQVQRKASHSPQTLPGGEEIFRKTGRSQNHCSLTPKPETTSTHPSGGS